MRNVVTSGMMTYQQGKKQDILMLHAMHEVAGVYLMLTPSKCLLYSHPGKKKKKDTSLGRSRDLPWSVYIHVQKELITYRV